MYLNNLIVLYLRFQTKVTPVDKEPNNTPPIFHVHKHYKHINSIDFAGHMAKVQADEDKLGVWMRQNSPMMQLSIHAEDRW